MNPTEPAPGARIRHRDTGAEGNFVRTVKTWASGRTVWVATFDAWNGAWSMDPDRIEVLG